MHESLYAESHIKRKKNKERVKKILARSIELYSANQKSWLRTCTWRKC